jgi:FtsH-binding integral membrane protein
VAIGVASSVAMYLLFSACLYLKICTQTNDQTVWSFLYPFMAIPLYWIAMLVGFFAKFWKSDEQEQQSN